MANYQQIGDILGGMAAGLSGDAASWQRNMMAREEMANQRAEREDEKAYVMQQRQQQAQQQEQERAVARMKTMFSDGAAAYKMAYANDWNGVVKLAQHRMEMSKHFPGVDFSDTARIGELAARAAQGDQEAARSAMGELQQLVDVGRAQGLIAPPEEKAERGVVYMYDQLTGKRQAKAIEGAKEAMAQAGAGDIAKQFGSTDNYVDANGDIFTQTQVRDPATGGVSVATRAVDGSDKKPSGRLTPIGGAYGQTAAQALEFAGQKAGQEETGKEQAAYRIAAKKAGIEAKSMIPRIDEMIRINEAIDSGKTAEAQAMASKLFNLKGEDARNLGKFQSMAGQLLLSNIKQLGANPTEGERAYLQSISASLGQGTEINNAILSDLKAIQQRIYERGKYLHENPKADIGDLLYLQPEFEPSSTLGARQQTAKQPSGWRIVQ